MVLSGKGTGASSIHRTLPASYASAVTDSGSPKRKGRGICQEKAAFVLCEMTLVVDTLSWNDPEEDT